MRLSGKFKKEIKNGMEQHGLRGKIDDVNAMGNASTLRQIAEAEGWSWEYAQQVCLSKQGEELYNPKYALYYKVGTADVILALQTKGGTKKFYNSLPEEEKRIFDEEDVAKKIRADFKAELKRQLTGH